MKNPIWLALRTAMAALLCLAPGSLHAQTPPSGPPANILDSWSFIDTNTWTSDLGYSPISFTNLFGDRYGDGTSLMVDSTNPAWLEFGGFNSDGSYTYTGRFRVGS